MKYQIVYQIETFDDDGRQIDFEVIRSKKKYDYYDAAERARKRAASRINLKGWNALGRTETIVGLREVVEGD